jgi:hypothetical protein
VRNFSRLDTRLSKENSTVHIQDNVPHTKNGLGRKNVTTAVSCVTARQNVAMLLVGGGILDDDHLLFGRE